MKKETANATRAFWPVACAYYRADKLFSHCFDGDGEGQPVKTVNAAAKCLHDAASIAASGPAKLPAPTATTACAKSIETQIIDGVTGYSAALMNFVAWVDKNKGPLGRGMQQGKTFEDAFRDMAFPDEYTQLHEHLLKVGFNDCMRPFVVCDPGYETNGCAFPKLAARLGVGCFDADPSNRPVISRRTGNALR